MFLSRDTDFFPTRVSQISDPTTTTKRGGGKIYLLSSFLWPKILQNWELFSFWNRHRKRFKTIQVF
jgi:hypothetical protein